MLHSELDVLEQKSTRINSELKKGTRDSDVAIRKAMASNDLLDWTKYKKLRNIINNNIKTSEASYYSNAFSQSKGNSRKTWQTFNELTSCRTNNTTVKEQKNWSWMIPIFLILVSFLMLLMTIFQQLGPALPMKFLQMMINNDLLSII